MPAPHFSKARAVHRVAGMTLVELMIVIAVLSVVVTIAIPSYRGYIREGHLTTIRANMNGLRTVIEDFRLDNGGYGGNTTLTGVAAIDGRYGWEPGADISAYTYSVVVVSSTNYHVLGSHGPTAWVRCQNRFTTCCDSDSSAGAAVGDACL